MPIENLPPKETDMTEQEQMKKEMAQVAWEENMYQYQDMLDENTDIEYQEDYEENTMQDVNLTPKEKLKYEETAYDVAYKVGDFSLYVQSVDDGYDYTLYDKNLKIVDGGVYDDPNISMTEAINIITEDFVIVGMEDLQNRTAPMLDTVELLEKAESIEAQQIQSKKFETVFSENDDNSYAIYQLMRNDNTDGLRFERFSNLEKNGTDVDRENYCNVYTNSFPDYMKNNEPESLLNYLFQKLNTDHPADYKTASLSVSDVVALKIDGNISHHYVDSFGFKQIEFNNLEQQIVSEKNSEHIKDMVEVIAENPQELYKAISKDLKLRNRLNDAVQLYDISSDLDQRHSYEDLTRIQSYSKDVWLKYEEFSFENVAYFATTAINKGLVTVDELVNINRKDFATALNEGNVDMLAPMEEVQGRAVNKHYNITDSKIIGDREIAVGESKNGVSFATWERDVTEDTENWVFGHYFDTMDKAVEDFNLRIDDMFEIAQKETNSFHDKDLFYIDEKAETFTWVYYNPDSNEGGQFVINELSYADVGVALAQSDDPNIFFNTHLADRAKQTLADIGTADFENAKRLFTSDTHTLSGLTPYTMRELAKKAENYLETAEKSVEQNYNKIDGIINNVEKPKERKSVLKALNDAKKQIAQPKDTTTKEKDQQL